MRISEYFNLDRTQPSLDFVDVDIEGDTRVFVDPRALRLLHSRWGDECVALVQSFFSTVLTAIHEGRDDLAQELLSFLREPNEVHLGLSVGKARGRALGGGSVEDVWEALGRSEAVRSGLLEDLEDTVLMVEGISSDIVSDIAVNIIRQPLIHYTQGICEQMGIPLQEGVAAGALWNPAEQQWNEDFVPQPVTEHGKLLLVPKAIVRRRLDYDKDEYYNDYLLATLREQELNANTELVRLLKDGRRKVTKKDLVQKFGNSKSAIVRETLKHPEVLDRYREAKRNRISPPLTHLSLAVTEGTPPPDWDGLLAAVQAIPPGREGATAYERAIEALLTALFYPALTNPQIQRRIHAGRKIIDITYTNVAVADFFYWLLMHYTAPHVFVECKNYAGEVGNPELDQLAGRFSPSRGTFGLLVCRNFDDKELFIQRCRDTANDRRGFIVPLDDADLAVLVAETKEPLEGGAMGLLKDRFDRLVM